MKQIRFFTWLGLLMASLAFLAGCLPPSSAAQGGVVASPSHTDQAPDISSSATLAATVKPSVANDTPAPGVTVGISGISSGPVASSLVLTGTVSAPSQPLSTAGSTPLEVTLADQGRTIVMRVGERFLLNLEGGDAWIVEIADQAVLSPVTAAPVPQDTQGLFEARAVGRTVLIATNEPACRKTKPPCMLPTRAFQVEVVVQ